MLGLVVAGGVEGQRPDELAGVGEDADVASGDEDGDVGEMWIEYEIIMTHPAAQAA